MYKNINIITYKNKKNIIYSLIDNLEFLINRNPSDLIDTISYLKLKLKIIYKHEVSPFIKENIELLWMELNKPPVIHIIKTEPNENCICCNFKPQKEDEEIKEYIKYLNVSHINE